MRQAEVLVVLLAQLQPQHKEESKVRPNICCVSGSKEPCGRHDVLSWLACQLRAPATVAILLLNAQCVRMVDVLAQQPEQGRCTVRVMRVAPDHIKAERTKLVIKVVTHAATNLLLPECAERKRVPKMCIGADS